MIPKFRAWDKENEKMLEVANISFDKEVYGYDLITIDKTKESNMLWTFTKLEDFILMQSTGLKDKNDDEIYEGDILKFTTQEFNGGEYIDINNIESVEYCDGAYFVGDHLLGQAMIDDDELEMIGNIYENPELLKEVAE